MTTTSIATLDPPPSLFRRLGLVVIAILGLFLGQQALAAMVVEVLPLGFRSSAEILPILRAIVPKPGSVNGFQNQIVIKTTPENLAEVRRVLASLDSAPANLMISVRHTVNDEVRRNLLAAAGQIRNGNVSISAGQPTSGTPGLSASVSSSNAAVTVRSVNTVSRTASRDVQSIRVLEGHQAFIHTGQSIPFAQRNVIVSNNNVAVVDGIEYRDVTSGVYVSPRLNGDRVTLEISPHRDNLSVNGGGQVDVYRTSTVVSGPLGRWIALSGVDQSQHTTSSGIAAQTSRRFENQVQTFVKVVRLP